MAEHDEHKTQPPAPAGEGIRIIGAEEAASALETGAAEGRRPADAPRFGDVPPPPVSSRPPALRFPLDTPDETEIYGDTEGVAGTRVDPPFDARPIIAAGSGTPPELPHWTEPATGEVPRILPDQEPEQDSAWSGFTKAPRWRGSGDEWDESDFGDASVLADDETRLGALDTNRTEHSDLYTFDDPEPPPTRIRTRTVDDDGDDEPVEAPRRPAAPTGGRDNTQATVIGAALGAVFLVAAALGPKFLLVYSTAIVVFLTAEIYAVLRRAGYKPATLLGLVATLSIAFGAYWQGERAIPLVLALTVVFTFLWYLAGVVHARPTVNVAASLMAFLWGGFLGSFAALLVRPHGPAGAGRWGVAFLLAAVLLTVVNDVIAYVAGQAFGKTPLAPNISPGKTVEGFIAALVATVLTGAGIIGSIHPFGHASGFWLGLVIAIVAPLGDLSQSMIKRDIGLKDMSSALPGHGGLADRFDGLLFALPATYYLIQVLHVGR